MEFTFEPATAPISLTPKVNDASCATVTPSMMVMRDTVDRESQIMRKFTSEDEKIYIEAPASRSDLLRRELENEI